MPGLPRLLLVGLGGGDPLGFAAGHAGREPRWVGAPSNDVAVSIIPRGFVYVAKQ